MSNLPRNLPGNLSVGHVVEVLLWLLLAALLYAWSFDFDREIEIYKFGASAWPRVIILLIAIAAIGQLAHHFQFATPAQSAVDDNVSDDSFNESMDDSPRKHASIKWYLWTFFLLSLPFAYMLLPQWIAPWFSSELSAELSSESSSESSWSKAGLHAAKLTCAGVLIALYMATMRGNLVGAMLALPIFFGALMQDFGFYALAPFFAVGVMYLMGERRPGWIALVTAIIMGLMLMLFVSVLYVGLPTGNISPFYEIGTGVVNFLT